LIAEFHYALFAALLALLALAVAWWSRRALANARNDVRATNDALASRVSELATVHAIGREILATLDPQRIFEIVERECRKIFDVDFFFIGILDRDTSEIRIAYRASGEDAPTNTSRPLSDGLAAWIVREKRALRIDDASAEEPALPFHPHMVHKDVRSVLAVPLLVGERVVGVLSLQSRRPRAYDEHQLSVLATIAQQAAVAVENAHHYTLATIDSLTGLHLRDYFFRRFEEEYTRVKRYAGTFSILMLDLDGFKEINDHHGHLAGDRYLRALGAAIRTRMRGADLACRYGGDEFCILLPETDLAGARPIAERLRLALARLVVDVEGASLRTTVSIGIATYPEHDTGEIKGLLLRADQALYQAKRAGRDRVVPFAA
jgi:diguanylate cyclase (GGDEF)-like protein